MNVRFVCLKWKVDSKELVLLVILKNSVKDVWIIILKKKMTLKIDVLCAKSLKLIPQRISMILIKA